MYFPIYVWPNGTWCDPENETIEDYAYLGDDYATIMVDDPDAIEEAVAAYLNQGN